MICYSNHKTIIGWHLVLLSVLQHTLTLVYVVYIILVLVLTVCSFHMVAQALSPLPFVLLLL